MPIAAVLRLVNLATPKGKLFDEVYYAIEGNQLLKHFVEFDVKVDNGVETELNTPRYVVHPPLGKWCIALGEQLFGYNEFGWRICGSGLRHWPRSWCMILVTPADVPLHVARLHRRPADGAGRHALRALPRRRCWTSS